MPLFYNILYYALIIVLLCVMLPPCYENAYRLQCERQVQGRGDHCKTQWFVTVSQYQPIRPLSTTYYSHWLRITTFACITHWHWYWMTIRRGTQIYNTWQRGLVRLKESRGEILKPDPKYRWNRCFFLKFKRLLGTIEGKQSKMVKKFPGWIETNGKQVAYWKLCIDCMKYF